jgi:putative addiction module component (TIGR02574 family)
MNVIELPQIQAMSIAEKINLVENLWDSIAQHDDQVPVLASHAKELSARLARYEGKQESLLTLQALQQKVAQRT